MSTYINMLGGGSGGSSGTSTSNPSMIMVSIPDIPVAGQVIIMPIPDGITLTIPANMEGSRGRADIAATAETIFDIQKNGTSIGSVTFAADATVATFTAETETTLSGADSDYLKIVAPDPADVTLEDIGIGIKCS